MFQELWVFWERVWPGVLLVGLPAAIAIWRASRTKKYLRAALRRKSARFKQRSSEQSMLSWQQQLETMATLSESFARSTPPTLQDLASNIDRDFELTRSAKR